MKVKTLLHTQLQGKNNINILILAVVCKGLPFLSTGRCRTKTRQTNIRELIALLKRFIPDKWANWFGWLQSEGGRLCYQDQEKHLDGHLLLVRARELFRLLKSGENFVLAGA